MKTTIKIWSKLYTKGSYVMASLHALEKRKKLKEEKNGRISQKDCGLGVQVVRAVWVDESV